jgi:hypothetical protein
MTGAADNDRSHRPPDTKNGLRRLAFSRTLPAGTAGRINGYGKQ